MTSALKKQIIDNIITREGGYVNNPFDSGGETNFGITANVARANGYTGAMREMTRETAFNILASEYWDKLNLDQIESRSPEVAEELADTAVNMGAARAGEFFQRVLNALNNGGTIYPDIKIDGVVGISTVRSFNRFMNNRGQQGVTILLRALNSLQGAFYIELAERRQTDEKFLAGWLLNRVK